MESMHDYKTSSLRGMEEGARQNDDEYDDMNMQVNTQ